MKDITVLGIDLAKNVYQIHGVNQYNKVVLRKRVKRNDLMAFIGNCPPCKIAIEACSGANYWGRQFQKHGHTVQVISPQHVKPFVKGNKTDKNDSEAIVIASQQERTPSVSIKNVEAQDIQVIHRIRERYLKNRTALSNQIRGFLAEYGVVINKGLAPLRKQLVDIICDPNNELTSRIRPELYMLYEELLKIDDTVKEYTKKLELLADEIPDCKVIQKIPGVGAITATAIVAHIGDAKAYRNGRHFAASLGLVPKEISSGEQRKLMKITRRGDVGLRALLVHGGRSVVRVCKKNSGKGNVWVQNVLERRGFNIAAVAVANKNARLIWALIRNQEAFSPERAWA